MNDDHADAVRLYATKLLGAPDGDWRCVGCDPEGLELQLGRTALRLPFPQRVRAPGRAAAGAQADGGAGAGERDAEVSSAGAFQCAECYWLLTLG